MAFPTLVSYTNNTQTTASTSLTVTKPSGVEPGDLIIITLTAPASGTAAWGSYAAYGFTSWAEGSDGRTWIYKYAQSGEPSSWTFTTPSGENITSQAWAIAYRNARVTSSFDGLASSSNPKSLTSISVNNNSMVLAIFAQRNQIGSFSTPTGFTALLDDTDSTAPDSAVFYKTYTDATTTGTISSTMSPSYVIAGASIAFEYYLSYIPTGYKTTDPNTGDKQDLGSRYVSKSYLMDVYPNLVAGRYSSGLYGWGNNNNVLGNLGALSSYSSPVQTGSLTNWKQFSGTGSATYAIKTDGTLWAWGLGSSGALGDGTTTNKSTPIQIGVLTNWKQVSAGSSFAVAVKTDGTLWSWGSGTDGKLGGIATGAGTTISRSSPVQIGTGTNWKFVSAGRAHCMAIKTDGSLWAWGTNYDVNYGANGQLGDGTTINKSSPVQIGSLKDWKKVMGGATSTVAVKTDGTLWSWGGGNASFNSGQLGDGTRVGKSTPIQIGTSTDWKDVHIGGTTCYAIKTDGTLWAWGDNSGKLGDGTTISKSSPIQIGSLTNWKKVSGGNFILTAIKTDGTLWTCGTNFTGTMGDGTTESKSSPVQIGTLTNWRQVDDLGNGFTRGILGGEI